MTDRHPFLFSMGQRVRVPNREIAGIVTRRSCGRMTRPHEYRVRLDDGSEVRAQEPLMRCAEPYAYGKTR